MVSSKPSASWQSLCSLLSETRARYRVHLKKSAKQPSLHLLGHSSLISAYTLLSPLAPHLLCCFTVGPFSECSSSSSRCLYLYPASSKQVLSSGRLRTTYSTKSQRNMGWEKEVSRKLILGEHRKCNWTGSI
ncbi:hypothetical protein SISSUDRAFT_576633 [Sistotremastrum suecicum HHB10207 ss-3]|uniref:Uncharacterized protein n=1 Tax=Sistotremastrum suecicum HHB10207 ss-3 TaxID=1314776 RepID=A0A165XF80_9AGAM|nr:hypothetical protein SISSUDRAFT_576633 [Sistotremastrum suecicum HHB10207 ss-3]